MPDKTNLDWALHYAEQGLHVFPVYYALKDGGCSCHKGDCGRIGKHPITKNGVLDATTDPEQIRRWWAKNKNYNIAIATGHDGLVVIDADTGIDEKTRRVKQGPENLAKLEEANGKLPPTLMQRTGSGGIHYLFRSTKVIKNDNSGKIAQDVDVRGKSGYVVVPPSNHKSNGHYEWLNEGTPIAQMPEWLETMCPVEDADKQQPVDVAEDEAKKFDKDDTLNRFTKDEVRQLMDVIPPDERDYWWKVGAALKTEYGEDGFDMWDEWSRKSTKYQANVQKVQWQSFRPGEISAGTIFHFAKEHGWRGFDAQTADEPTFRENWVYVVGIKRFIELNTMQELDQEQFSAKFAHLFRRKKAAEMVLSNENFRKLDAVTYWPDQSRFVEENGLKKLNLWQSSGVQAVPGDITPFLEHLKYLFPEQSKQDIILDYLAFQAQKPGQKVHWALLIQGVPGNGKSYFADVMKHVLGPHNVRFINSDTLHETFTGWQKATQFIVVEELMTRGRTEIMNKLKPMITEPWASIREMYKPPYEQPNRFNFLFLTNHKDSIIIDETDRRYCVLYSKAPPHPKGAKYYDDLFAWTAAHPGALLYHLQQRDLSRFVAKGHAPATEDRETLIEESRPPLDRFLADLIDAERWPFNVDLVAPFELAPVMPELGMRASSKEIGGALRRLGCTKLGYRRVGADRDAAGKRMQIELWAVRNGEQYQKLDTEKVRAAWLSQIQGAPDATAVDAFEVARQRSSVVKQTRSGAESVAKESKPM